MVLTAGVPGAGKSTLVNALDDRDAYREIDPDIFKQICLTIAEREGILDDWLGHTLADGRPLCRGELSSLVHTYSTDLADELEDRCYLKSESFIRQGTFSWPQLHSQYLNRLEDLGGYEGYQVVAVEIGRTQALAQADSRWWDALHQRFPGRPLPPASRDQRSLHLARCHVLEIPDQRRGPYQPARVRRLHPREAHRPRPHRPRAACHEDLQPHPRQDPHRRRHQARPRH
ncbi:zeta toxin family protein [Brevibacterium sp.]|uniref:zeta toxin family protein n=1 Tax=Brevibacterium sp. TaxID=1701 RepID=UPI0035C87206